MLSLSLLLFLASASAEQVEKGELEARLNLTAARLGETFLVGAVGDKAERAVNKALDRSPRVKVKLTRIPSIGDADAEMVRAMGEINLRCGLYVAPSDAGGWTVHEHGDCTSAAAIRAESEPQDDGSADRPAPGARQRPPAQRRGQAPSPPSDSRTLIKIAQLQPQLPDPATAMLQSTLLGFGAGHFYSGRTERGLVHMGLQVAGLGLSGLGTTLVNGAQGWSNADTRRKAGLAFTITGSLTFVGSRVTDIYTAPLSAHEEGAERMAQMR